MAIAIEEAVQRLDLTLRDEALRVPQRPPKSSLSSINRSTIGQEEIIDVVAPTLTMVRPAGMSDAEATEWIAMAASDLSEYPVDVVRQGCKFARKTVSHHGQLLPAIVARCTMVMKNRRIIAARDRKVPISRQIAPKEKQSGRPLSQSEIDALPRHLVDLGISCGAIVETPDGLRAAA